MNKPIYVNRVETNYELFHSCGYNKLIVSDGVRTINLLEDEYLPALEVFELVAGSRNNTHIITIDIDSETDECSLGGEGHKNKVLSLVQYPEKGVVENAKQKEKSSVTFNSSVNFHGGDKKNYIKTQNQLAFEGKLEKYTEDGDDKKLKFKARYIYDTKPLNLLGIQLHPILRYIWLGKGVQTNTYLVKTNTCRYQHNVKIITYPDVAWSFRLSYNNSKTIKEFVSNQTYKDTNNASFKRPPQKWTKIGDKFIGISLDATWDKKEKFDAAADITEQVRKMVDKLGVIGEFLNRVFLAEENKKDESYKTAEKKHKDALNSVVEKQKQKVEIEGSKEKELKKLRDNFNNAKNRYIEAEEKALLAPTEEERNKAAKEMDKAEGNLNSLQRKMDSTSAKLDLKLKRSVFSVEIQLPQIEAEFKWYRENIKQNGPFYNHTGVVLEGILKLTPLIGITATLDFLALAQRAHPVALAVIAAADITMAIIGDGSKITCELSAEGKLGGKLQGFLNTKTGENTFNRKDRSANKKEIAEINCNIEFKLKVGITLKKETRKFFINVLFIAEGVGTATAKWKGSVPIDADDNGWYIAPELEFEGLEVKVNLNAEVKVGENDSPYLSGKSTNELKWQAIDKSKEPYKFDKCYFVKQK